MRAALAEGIKKDVSHGYKHVYDLLEHAVRIAPEKGTYYIREDGSEEKVTYSTQKKTALGILASLQRKGVKKGDYLIADVSDTKNYHFLMWACFYGGIIITALPRPDFSVKDSETVNGTKQIWEMLGKPVFVTDDEMKNLYERVLGSGKTESMQELFSEDKGNIAEISRDDAAYIQFSSGSTGNKKGAVLSNENLIEASCGIVDFEQCTDSERPLMWLPHTHNFGAFTFCLLSVVLGIDSWSMKTETFVRNPVLFMQKVTQHRVTRLCTNNLGLGILVQMAAQVDTRMFDLSALAAIYIGSEKPSVKLMGAFAALYHINENVFRAGYGMSETVLTVASSRGFDSKKVLRISRKEMSENNKAVAFQGENPEESICLLEHGRPVTNVTIGIFNEKNQLLEENEIGSIRVKSATVFQGYCNSNTGNDESIFADGWFITGDIGFIRDGQLYIAGRSKDIIIIRGVNYMLTDLEAVVQNRLGKEGKVVFIASENESGEELVAFFEHEFSEETKKHYLESVDKIKGCLGTEFGLEVKTVIPVSEIKMTASRKLDRYGMKRAYQSGEYNDILQKVQELEAATVSKNEGYGEQHQKLAYEIRKCWGKVLNLDPEGISFQASFKSIGGNSVKGFFLIQEIEEFLRNDGRPDIKLNQNLLVKCATIQEMTDYIEGVERETKSGDMQAQKEKEVAITGMAFRLPGASTQEELWKNLEEGKDCVHKVSEKRKKLSKEESWDDIFGEIEEIDAFDYEFFNITKEEADFMDPQQRLSLEVAYEALDDSGEGVIDDKEKNIAILAATSGNSYYPLLLDYVKKNGTKDIPPMTMVGNLGSTIATRVAQYLNSRGCAMAIDSACSSFMTAFLLAEKMIQSGECEGALVLGANIFPTSYTHAIARCAGILSKGDCTKVFDKNADGSLLGEGVVAVYLEGLEHARKYKKNIYGVIAGGAMNNDGTSLSVMAPNPAGQYDVLKKAYQESGVNVSDITYIEAHGTGTKIGDPIELSALQQMFQGLHGENGEEKVPVGSIKSNFGHLLPCAGGAGLIKVLLCLKNNKLVPSLHVDEVNPLLEKKEFPLRIITEVQDWKRPENGCRYAGISSFGIGGTNAHVIIKDAPADNREASGQKYYLVAASAKDEYALSVIQDRLSDLLQEKEIRPEDLSYTLQMGRNHYKYRLAFVIDEEKNICGDKATGMRYRVTGSKVVVLSENDFMNEGERKVFSDMIKRVTSGKCCLREKDEEFKADCVICLNASEEFMKHVAEKAKEVRGLKYSLAEEERELSFQLLLKELYACGAEIDWEQVWKEEAGRIISLPAYPFKKTTAWIES